MLSDSVSDPFVLRHQGTFVVVLGYSPDLPRDVAEFLRVSELEIAQRISRKFKKIGVKSFAVVQRRVLTDAQVRVLMEWVEPLSTSGIGFLSLAWKGDRAYGRTAIPGTGESRVFVGNLFPKVPGLIFRIAEVGSHELGHSQGFSAGPAIWTFLKYHLGLADLMCEGMPLPVRPLEFSTSDYRIRNAVRIINEGLQPIH
jgi:hypothetical protein